MKVIRANKTITHDHGEAGAISGTKMLKPFVRRDAVFKYIQTRAARRVLTELCMLHLLTTKVLLFPTHCKSNRSKGGIFKKLHVKLNGTQIRFPENIQLL